MSFFSKWKSVGLIYKGYLLKRMKHIKIREEENSQGPPQSLATPNALNQTVWGWGTTLYFNKSSR